MNDKNNELSIYIFANMHYTAGLNIDLGLFFWTG